MKKIYFLLAFVFVVNELWAQTPVPMAGQANFTYTENFADIANWTNNFASGIGANRWGSVAINASGTIGDGVKTTVSTATFSTGTSGGVQKGTGTINLLSTGTTNACAIDLYLNFTGVNAGTVSFDVAEINNSTGDRDSKLKLFYTTDGTTFTEITGTNLPFTARNNVPTSASISVSLPAAINNSATVRLRFYEFSTTTGGTPTGSQPKISIDNVSVSGTPFTPTTTSISPTSATAGDPGFTLTVNGTNFYSGVSTVRWNGGTRTTTFVNGGQLTATINAADVAVAGSATVDVLNTGNATPSNGQTFTINAGGAATITTSASSLTSFGNVVTGNNSVERSYTVSGTNLTANIVITAPGRVEISTVSGTYTGTPGNTINLTPSSGTVATTTIYARFEPNVANGAMSGNITNTSTGATQKDVAVSGSAIDVEPTLQSSLSFGALTTTSIVVNFSGGNGTKRILVAKSGSAVSVDPADAATYTDGAGAFGSGSNLGGGNFVVYAGTGNTQTVNTLNPGTTYFFAVYEYNDNNTSGAENYLTPGGTGNATTSIATYTWGGGSGSWATAVNWIPARNTPNSNDIMQFNDGATYTLTNVPTQTIGQLLVSNGSKLTLQTAAGNTLTIGGGTGTDLSVASGCQLNLDGTNALTINLSTGTTGNISGSMTFTAGAHRLTATDASSITFGNGSSFTGGTGFSGNSFGTTSLNSIIFASGSQYIGIAGSNPFGATAPNTVVVFQGGSLYSHQQTGAPSLSGRTYSNFELNSAAAAISATGGNPLSFDNLTITSGLINLNLTGGISIKGNISVASGATLGFSPASANTISLNGGVAQSISNSGTLTFGPNESVTINNSNGITLNTSITLSATFTLTSGNVNTTTFNMLTLASTATLAGGSSSSYINGPFSWSTATTSAVTFPVGKGGSYRPVDVIPASASAGSYTAEYFNAGFTDFTLCNSYLDAVANNEYWNILQNSGSGAMIRLNYAASNTWSNSTSPNGSKGIVVAHYTGTCWNAETGTILPGTSGPAQVTSHNVSNFSPWTFGYGPIAVLPVSFTDVRAYQFGSAIKIDWTNATESNILNYNIERSADGVNFSTIGTAAAYLNNATRANYSFIDQSPVNGNNYYRIVSHEQTGSSKYSVIVKVSPKQGSTTMDVYPNPVIDKQLSLQLTSLPKGTYSLRIFDANGRKIYDAVIDHTGGSITEAINLPATINSGVYNIVLSGGETKLTKTFVVQ